MNNAHKIDKLIMFQPLNVTEYLKLFCDISYKILGVTYEWEGERHWYFWDVEVESDGWQVVEHYVWRLQRRVSLRRAGWQVVEHYVWRLQRRASNDWLCVSINEPRQLVFWTIYFTNVQHCRCCQVMQVWSHL